MYKTEIISSGLLELYVARLTTGEETREVEQWAAQYPEVKAEITAIEKALEAQAMANAVQPAAHIKNKLMAAIAPKEQSVVTSIPAEYVQKPTATTVIRPMWRWLAAASVALLLVSAYISFSLYSKNKQYEERLASIEKERDSNLTLAKQQHVADHLQMESMLQSGLTHIALHNTGKVSGECEAKIFWDKTTGAVYIDPCKMLQTPQGKTYQLWAIVNGKPVDAGLVKLTGDEDKYSIQKMKQFKNAQAFAITLEKEGGSPTPTMEQMYVMGQV